MTNDEQEKGNILNQVQEKKQRAIALNLMEIIEHLYSELKTIHNSIKHDHCILKEGIADARCIHDEHRLQKILFKMKNGNEYMVVCQQYDSYDGIESYDDCIVTGGYEFLLYVGEQKVLGVTLQRESDIELPFSYYRTLDISAFHEGDWIKDLQELHRLERIYSDAIRAKYENNKLKHLKDDFGIE